MPNKPKQMRGGVKEKNNCKKCGKEKSKHAMCQCSRGYIVLPEVKKYPPMLDAFGSPRNGTEMFPNESNAPIIKDF